MKALGRTYPVLPFPVVTASLCMSLVASTREGGLSGHVTVLFLKDPREETETLFPPEPCVLSQVCHILLSKEEAHWGERHHDLWHLPSVRGWRASACTSDVPSGSQLNAKPGAHASSVFSVETSATPRSPFFEVCSAVLRTVEIQPFVSLSFRLLPKLLCSVCLFPSGLECLCPLLYFCACLKLLLPIPTKEFSDPGSGL